MYSQFIEVVLAVNRKKVKPITQRLLSQLKQLLYLQILIIIIQH